MRPGSSRMMLGTSSGNPPSTGVRPGSGRRPPSTSRLRPGSSSGSGTEAAQGLSLTASINVNDRPMSGHGVSGMRPSTGTGRIVEDVAYYIGLLRKKITEISEEIKKLEAEYNQLEVDKSQYAQNEKRYETLLKDKERLEGELADYNLALDKHRSSTQASEVYSIANQMKMKNRNMNTEVDNLFKERKTKEMKIYEKEEEIEEINRYFMSKISELDPSKSNSYTEYSLKKNDLENQINKFEYEISNLDHAINSLEGDNKFSELMMYDKKETELLKEKEFYEDEYKIVSSDPKEAHSKYVDKIQKFKNKTKLVENDIEAKKREIANLQNEIRKFDSDSNGVECTQEDIEKYELLVKRQEEMNNFFNNYEETYENLLKNKKETQYMIVALLEYISKNIEDSTNLPSQEAVLDMNDAKNFKLKNLETAQKTMENLIVEKKKREKEIEALNKSEPKLKDEIEKLKNEINRMENDIKQYEDIDKLHIDFNTIKSNLNNLKTQYVKRRDILKSQIQSISSEYENLKQKLNNDEIYLEFQDTEKKLRHYERQIFDLKESIDIKEKEIDFEHYKLTSLSLIDTINNFHIKNQVNN